MNTKAGLGVSPIISVSYSVATIWGHNFGNTTLLLYSVFVLAEMILHSLLAYRRKKAGVPYLSENFLPCFSWTRCSSLSA